MGKLQQLIKKANGLLEQKRGTEVQQLRQEADAVITGVETIIQDDAGLIVKDSNMTQPIRVILDSTLRIPLHAKCLTDHMAETIICTSQKYDQKKYDQLMEKGHQVFCHKRRTADGYS